MNINELIEYVKQKYGTSPEYLWRKYPRYFVFRHLVGKKWFAVIMDVPGQRIGLVSDEPIYIMNVKCGSIMLGSFLSKPGFLPAYHMNKANWISVRLDGSAAREDIFAILDISYGLTEK